MQIDASITHSAKADSPIRWRFDPDSKSKLESCWQCRKHKVPRIWTDDGMQQIAAIHSLKMHLLRLPDAESLTPHLKVWCHLQSSDCPKLQLKQECKRT
jgi:hypothetical protein